MKSMRNILVSRSVNPLGARPTLGRLRTYTRISGQKSVASTLRIEAVTDSLEAGQKIFDLPCDLLRFLTVDHCALHPPCDLLHLFLLHSLPGQLLHRNPCAGAFAAFR